LLLLLPAALLAQNIDTTQRINTWTLQHNYTRFEPASPDTTLEDIHRMYNLRNSNVVMYNSLGIICNAIQDVDYLNRPASRDFLFSSVFRPYLASPENTVFYNTKVPFTEVSYTTTISLYGMKEETASALHTQNMNPFTNFGFRLDLASGSTVYSNDDSHISSFTFFGSHAHDKYSAFGTFHFNDIKLKESGGLIDPQGFLSGVETDPLNSDMVLSGATSQLRNVRLFFTHKYNLDERVSNTDSLGVTHTKGQNISIAHQFQFQNNLRKYSDARSAGSYSALYDTVYYPQSSVLDSAREDLLSNVFQLIWGDPYGDKMSARVYAGHELIRYSNRFPETGSYYHHTDTLSYLPLTLDSVYRDTVTAGLSREFVNDLFLGVHLAGPTGKKWDWNADGKYYFAGYYANDFALDFSMKRKLGEFGLTGIHVSYALEKPNYYIDQYSSAFFRWENQFAPQLNAKAEGYLKYDRHGSEIRFRVAQLANLIYWDTLALPRQAATPVYLLSGYLRENLVAGGFHSDNRLLVQLPSDAEVLPLPLLAFYTSTYWEQSLFKGALLAQLGFDLNITTRYYGSAYMPAIAVFYNQNESLTGAYPFLDAFLNLKMKRTRFFFSWTNVLSGIAGNNYFNTWRYPQKPRFLRFGLVWTFYN